MTRNVVSPPRISVPTVDPAAVTPNWRSSQLSLLAAVLRTAIFPSLASVASGAGQKHLHARCSHRLVAGSGRQPGSRPDSMDLRLARRGRQAVASVLTVFS